MGVDKAILLNLLWVPHYNHTPITILVIKQLLGLVHDGCLWLEEPIPITKDLFNTSPCFHAKERTPQTSKRGRAVTWPSRRP